MPNFATVGQSITEISRFFDFEDGSMPHHRSC